MAPLTCFLIDDDEDDQIIFKLALDGLDKPFQFAAAGSATEALQILSMEEGILPDFIFLDLNMPRINGRQCLAELKKISRLQDVPIIIYSTSSEQRDKSETAHLGASFFITKPANIDDLTQALSGLFQAIKTMQNLS